MILEFSAFSTSMTEEIPRGRMIEGNSITPAFSKFYDYCWFISLLDSWQK